MLKRLLAWTLPVAALSACTPAQVAWMTAEANREDRDAVVEHVIREAAAEFGVDGDLMVRIARCESGLDPSAKNRSSSATGLFQHLANYWPARAVAVDMEGASIFDPVAQSRASANMIAHAGTSAWNPSAHCWRR